ncbi:MAG: molybdate ABC transporter substrate-binding protein [Rhodocyclaceae bacterium]|nr:molybdate ABC transporter substrate-binding protein [Rhodocyclaceae bacterium]
MANGVHKELDVSRWLVLLSVCLSFARPAAAGEVQAAVAANFTAPMQKLAPLFEQQTGHRVVASYGSTGKLAAQIQNGAPFEVFLAADDETPAKLERNGAAVNGTRFTYAIGRLVLWSREPGRVDGNGEVLRGDSFDRLAIADPRLAPYGAAAVQTLRALGLHERLQPRLVTGENITQAHQFVATGNAQLGFVALSQVQVDGRIAEGSAWVVPARLHESIVQHAVLLAIGQDKPAARALLEFLRSEPARALIRKHGYDVPGG